jgi:hypothetical protein
MAGDSSGRETRAEILAQLNRIRAAVGTACDPHASVQAVVDIAVGNIRTAWEHDGLVEQIDTLKTELRLARSLPEAAMTGGPEKVTQANAERFVRARHPKARCTGQRTNGGERYYLVHLAGGFGGEMYAGDGKTKPAAWRSAAECIARRDAKAAADPAPAPVSSQWVVEVHGGVVKGSRLNFGSHQIIVHRHRDEDPGRWFYSCHRFGIERRGVSGDSIEAAQTAAVVDLAKYLDAALTALRAVR